MKTTKFSSTAAAIAVLLMIVVSSFSSEATSQTQPGSSNCLCGHVQARNVGQILFGANPLTELDEPKWNQFKHFIESNAQLLGPGSPTITCAKNLGSAFLSQGIRSYSRQDYDNAYGNVLGMGGDMDKARGVADSMMSGSLDAFATGQELIWLSEVLPSASQGNWQKYFNTGTQSRQQVRQVIQIYKMMPDMIATLREVQPIIDQFGPIASDQMVMASCLFKK